MSDTGLPSQIIPGRGLGWITLGASLHSILTRFHSQPSLYPKIELSYSSSEPVLEPVVLALPTNGFRLRFDGPDQRLRLIEITDFSKAVLLYKRNELVRRARPNEGAAELEQSDPGPSFRQVYKRLFGPTYPGEYLPPEPGRGTGTYVLSYPGIAFTFPFRHKAWSEKSDFVALLSSQAASNASCLAIFEGASWPDARSGLYVRVPNLPRSLALCGVHSENFPDEVDSVIIRGMGSLTFNRRTSTPVDIILGGTTPQDLVAEFGPPDAIYRKSDNRISIHGAPNVTDGQRSSRPHSADTNHSSTFSHAHDSDSESNSMRTSDEAHVSEECFYNYFHHGFDALVSSPTSQSPLFLGTGDRTVRAASQSDQVVTKILLHANIPGSYPFNRHRRSRWEIQIGADSQDSGLSSETKFSQISDTLRKVWHGVYADADEEKSMQRGMVLNRGWGESPDSSIELLGGFEETPDTTDSGHDPRSRNLPSTSNTELFGFPGLLFEVLKNDAVSCLTVY